MRRLVSRIMSTLGALAGPVLGMSMLCGLPMAAPFSPQGTTYYVSSTGRDNDSGTSQARAWRTISRVNQQRLRAGDNVLLQGGSTFTGTIMVSPSEFGTAADPITFGSFGTGRAIVWANSDRGIDIYNTSGIRIQDLELTGAGVQTNHQVGISLFVDLPGDVKLEWIRIDNVRATGFGRAGISIGGGNGRTGFEDVWVTNSRFDHNGDCGMLVWADTSPDWPQTIDGYAHRNLYIAHNTFESNWGDPGTTSATGSGIVVGQTAVVRIEYNESFDNGRLNRFPTGGPVGIWMWDVFMGVIQHNESHHNVSATYDGGGFDLDGGCVQCAMKFNYSHDNDGPGFLVTQFGGSKPMSKVSVRYNISERDGGRAGAAGLQLWNNDVTGPRLQSIRFQNNTVFVEGKPIGIPRGFRTGGSGLVEDSGFTNNIFYSRGLSAYVGEATMQTCQWIDNLYFAEDAFVIRGIAFNFTSLSAWRATSGHEMLDGVPTGYQFDPMLMAPGDGGTVGAPELLGALTAYELLPQSAAHDIALDWRDFGLSMGHRDFYDGPAPLGPGYDIGAHEGR